jgi:squalene-hopene/tetraprenyl-beta-curcumene cyclase
MNTYAKLYLALLGQFPWKYLPTIPVESILFPKWFFFNIYEMSSWSRAMIIPLAIINHFKPTRHLPADKHLHELYPAGLEQTDLSLPRDPFWPGAISSCACSAFKRCMFCWNPCATRCTGRGWMVERMGEGATDSRRCFPRC